MHIWKKHYVPTSFMIVFIYLTMSQELPPSFSFNCSKWMNPTNVNILLSSFSLAIYIYIYIWGIKKTTAPEQPYKPTTFSFHISFLQIFGEFVCLCIYSVSTRRGEGLMELSLGNLEQQPVPSNMHFKIKRVTFQEKYEQFKVFTTNLWAAATISVHIW